MLASAFGVSESLETSKAIRLTEVSLDISEVHDGAVSASTAELALAEELRREADRVVERQTEGLVGLLTALAAVEAVYRSTSS